MKLYEKLDYLSHWIKYQSRYLEMKYHVKQTLKGMEECYIKPVYPQDRGSGKSTALARLSVKYDIPIVVPTQRRKKIIEQEVPRHIPQYFKRKKPIVIVASETCGRRGYKIVLIDEGLTNEQIKLAVEMSKGTIVGYKGYQ